ncbi:hypothetical protein CAEBREN_12230 [Caenorhabditis brenneri]|uniref:Uncharacterized protein n=1 Tax=Caenorhabditis brenneri TaxID=135651 RepID=G0NVK4_CAEBE|nr:hypothetical protein CAEBREN_12230 [Caenorhabditis brenneri]
MLEEKEQQFEKRSLWRGTKVERWKSQRKETMEKEQRKKELELRKVDYHNHRNPHIHFALIDMIKEMKFQSINGISAENKDWKVVRFQTKRNWDKKAATSDRAMTARKLFKITSKDSV